jgi:hypothetical protein
VNDVQLTTPAAAFCAKGRDAAQVLLSLGVQLPDRPNSLRVQPGSGLWCLRLGSGEYLLAHDTDSALIDELRARTGAASPACHALLRSDSCVHLRGSQATSLLLQSCDIDDRVFQRQPDAVALVLLADVSVTLHAIVDAEGVPGYRIWCDPTYATHLLETFERITTRSSPSILSRHVT